MPRRAVGNEPWGERASAWLTAAVRNKWEARLARVAESNDEFLQADVVTLVGDEAHVWSRRKRGSPLVLAAVYAVEVTARHTAVLRLTWWKTRQGAEPGRSCMGQGRLPDDLGPANGSSQ